jgi:hypothetical protein
MGHPLEANAGHSICNLLEFYPGNLTEESLPEVFLSGNIWDRAEYDAGLAYAESHGWVRRTRGRVTLRSGRRRAD